MWNRRVVWVGVGDDDKVFDFDIPFICLHALSKDPSTW